MFPEIEASDWINTDTPPSLASLRGKVVVVAVFQMLCPGCAGSSLPQARNVHSMFSREDLIVIGLHSVFEHHQVMTPDALQVFVKEYRLHFPIAIDRPVPGSSVPATMRQWRLEGTPTLMVFARDGELALQHFGHLDDLRLGAVLGELIASRPAPDG
ncbi:redoxin domain-containing protein [Dechloromonas sp. XY25]|uniref:Redoxin domain-containing protein n=1 Tax=Dechloromonas hankyongensis TaxID=2908002 RepID=A0ABS9K7P7_9RHOO|nr:redoxin domain-containing protein [Dechloromonas hankyongensis]MCG2579193.1 redoxin domain-containing protein [Dechloromonas hankyongensis]